MTFFRRAIDVQISSEFSARKIFACGVGNHLNDAFNRAVKFGAVNVFVKMMRVVITARQIDGVGLQFGRDEDNVRERAVTFDETFCRDVRLEVGIVATVKNQVSEPRRSSSTINFSAESSTGNFF